MNPADDLPRALTATQRAASMACPGPTCTAIPALTHRTIAPRLPALPYNVTDHQETRCESPLFY